jgi:IPT/TIG domain-containing protein
MVQPITDPGTISVPMSSIVDALKSTLKNVLTTDEQTALFAQLGLSPGTVEPGDLITAELFNQILSDINDLSIRVAALEGTAGGPIIDHIEPPGDKPVASKLTIVGLNFRPDDADTFVSFGTVKIADFFLESDQSHIMVTVPVSLQGLPADVPVSVTCNGKTSNAVKIHVVPQVINPTGIPKVTYQGAPLPQIKVGDTYDLTWQVSSQVNVAQSFDLVPTVNVQSGTANAAAWLAEIKLTPPGPVPLEPGDSMSIAMKVKVPTGAGVADVGLRAESTTVDSIQGQGAPLHFAVGEAPKLPDNRALPAVAAFVSTAKLSGLNLPGEPKGFKIAPSQTKLPLPLQVATNAQGGGFYQFEGVVEPGTPAGGGGPQTTRWKIEATSSAPADLVDIPAGSTTPYQLQITSTALADLDTISHILLSAKHFPTRQTAQPDFTSYIRIPIAGK